MSSSDDFALDFESTPLLNDADIHDYFEEQSSINIMHEQEKTQKFSEESSFGEQLIDKIGPSEHVRKLYRKAEHVIQMNQAKQENTELSYGFLEILLRFAHKKDKLDIMFAYYIAVLAGAIQPLQVVYIGVIAKKLAYDFGAIDFNSTLKNCIGMLLCGIILFVLQAFYIVTLENKGLKISRGIQTNHLRAILNFEVKWIEKENCFTVHQNMVKQSEAIATLVGKNKGLQIQAMVCSICGIIYAFFFSPLFALALVLFLPILFGTQKLLNTFNSASIKSEKRAYSLPGSYALQALRSIHVVSAFGQEYTEIENYEKNLKPAKEKAERSAVGESFRNALMFGLLMVFTFYAFALGTILILNFEFNFNAGDVLICYLTVLIAIISFFEFLTQHKKQKLGIIAGNKAFDLIDQGLLAQRRHESTLKFSDLANQAARIEFQDVTFQYKRKRILKNFSIVFEEGKTTAIVGKIGSGKSTILKLIERFYDVQEGKILINGTNIEDFNLKDFRHRVGYIGQDSLLLNDTIRQNMLHANPDATEEDIISALKLANAYDIILKNFPQGIDSEIGSNGVILSQRLKQKIALAKIFVKHCQILLLDQAAFPFDSREEKETFDSIKQYREEKGSLTIILISNRLQTIKFADKIAVLNNGAVKEEGTHAQLIERYPTCFYAKIAHEQPARNFGRKQSATNSSTQENTFHFEGVEMKTVSQTFINLSTKQQTHESEYPKLLKMSRRVLKLSSNREIIISDIFSILTSATTPFLALNIAVITFALFRYFGRESTQILNTQLTISIVLILYSFIAQFASNFKVRTLELKTTFKLRSFLFRQIMSKHMGWFDKKNHSPDSISEILENETKVINTCGMSLHSVIIESFSSLFIAFLIALFFSWSIAIIGTILAILCAICFIKSKVIQSTFYKGVAQSQMPAHLYAEDLVLNYEIAASLSNHEVIISKFDQVLEKNNTAIVNKIPIFGIWLGLANTGIFISCSIVLLCSVYLIKFVDLRACDQFIAMFVILISSFKSICYLQHAFELEEARFAAEKILNIFDEPSQLNALDDHQNPRNYVQKILPPLMSPISRGKIQFKDVWFRYPEGNSGWILKGFSLEISMKESVALVGEPDSGKSTIINLLLRFYDPQYGKITLDGVDIQEYALCDLRRQLGVVFQQPILFNYSIYENILYGKGEASNSEIFQVANKTSINDFYNQFESEDYHIEGIEQDLCLLRERVQRHKVQIQQSYGVQNYEHIVGWLKECEEEQQMKNFFEHTPGSIDYRSKIYRDRALPLGYNQLCRINGCIFKRSQKQRIAIARALIRYPKIFLLDKALDKIDDDHLLNSISLLDEILKERTVLVISDQLSIIEKCERVVVINKGKVIEDGKLQVLKAKAGSQFNHFAQLVEQKKYMHQNTTSHSLNHMANE